MMGINLESSKILYKQLEKFIFSIRSSPKNVILFFLASVCFYYGKWLGDADNVIPLPSRFEEAQKIANQYQFESSVCLFAMATVLIVWVIYRLWKVALPSINTESHVSHAIKGLMPFDAEDGELFSKLERGQELEKLAQYVSSSQEQIIVFMGESGAGKSSLLRAGLSYRLATEKCAYLYWEAFPNNPIESLLESINHYLKTDYKQLEEVLNHPQEGVIVLDQFEQLSLQKHPDFFKFLTTLIKQSPPHKLTWVIAFRREYDPEWRDFELSLEDRYRHLPMLSLKLFTQEQAKNIFIILANEAGLTLNQDLVDGFISSIEENGVISPVDISIALLTLNQLASQKQKSHLNLQDYHFAGGSEGLFVGYINDKLARFSELEQQELLKALLALIDANGYKRVAEGKPLEKLLEGVDLPEQPLSYGLNYFASADVRLLEKRANGFYRLPHETIIPALRRLTGSVLAEVGQAELKLKTAYEAWQKSNAKNSTYLLKGKELRQVLKYWSQIGWQMDDKKKDFINKCKQKRNQWRLLNGSVILILLIFSFQGWQTYHGDIHKTTLESWGLPADLYDYQTQLEKLTIQDKKILHLRWLKKLPNLKELTLIDIQINNFDEIAEKFPNLTTLKLENTTLSNLQGLEKFTTLTSLDLSGHKNLKKLENLENLTALTTLNLSNSGLKNLQNLQNISTLKNLDLSENALESLQGLEKLATLTTLNLAGNSLKNLQVLEKLSTLTTLNLSSQGSYGYQELQRLPSVTVENFSDNLNLNLEKLSALTTLDLSENPLLGNVQGLEKLTKLTILNLTSSKKLSDLKSLEKLPKLKELNLSDNDFLSSFQGLAKLPELTRLNLKKNSLKNLQDLEKFPALSKLNLSDNDELISLQGLEKLTALRALNLSGAKISSLQVLEKLINLTSLNLEYQRNLDNLQVLEKLSMLTTLNLNQTYLNSYQGLKKLTTLTTLNLSDNHLENIQDLENLINLITLDLSQNYNLSSLQSLENLTALTALNLSKNRSLISLQGLENLTVLKSLNLIKTNIKSLQYLPKSVIDLKLGN